LGPRSLNQISFGLPFMVLQLPKHRYSSTDIIHHSCVRKDSNRAGSDNEKDNVTEPIHKPRKDTCLRCADSLVHRHILNLTNISHFCVIVAFFSFMTSSRLQFRLRRDLLVALLLAPAGRGGSRSLTACRLRMRRSALIRRGLCHRSLEPFTEVIYCCIGSSWGGVRA